MREKKNEKIQKTLLSSERHRVDSTGESMPKRALDIRLKSQLYSLGGSVIVPELRFSIRHDDVSSTYTLQISKIQETDTGLYQCQVRNRAPSCISFVFSLPIKSNRSLDLPFYMLESRLALRCDAMRTLNQLVTRQTS